MKKISQLCQKEIRRKAVKSQRTSKDILPRSKRLVKEVSNYIIQIIIVMITFIIYYDFVVIIISLTTFQMLLYWRKYEKVEREHRKRAEKEAQEQRRLDEEIREVLTQLHNIYLLLP